MLQKIYELDAQKEMFCILLLWNGLIGRSVMVSIGPDMRAESYI